MWHMAHLAEQLHSEPLDLPGVARGEGLRVGPCGHLPPALDCQIRKDGKQKREGNLMKKWMKHVETSNQVTVPY